ncbi:hypothetical protein PG988_013061 [Apiospora saccharicola]
MRVPHNTVQAGPSHGDEEERSVTGTTTTTCFGIRSDLLIPGRGQPIKNGAVVVEDATIEWVGDFSNRPAKYDAVKFHHVKFPCFLNPTYLPFGTSAWRVLTPDITTKYAGYLWPGIRDGYLAGPNVYSSLAALSITGGHGDAHELPLCAVKQFGEAGGAPYLCDGVDECIKAVRTMVRRGARCIKVCSSGGVLSLNDDPEDRQFSDDELKAIVDETERSGRAVAAHAIGKAGIMAALRAGIKSIEHGCYLDEEVAALMKEKGAILIATRHIQESLLLDPSGFPEPVIKKIKKIVPLTRKNYDLAIQQGVKIALGTDTWNSNPEHRVAHGKNATELTYAVQAGLTPLQAIEAMTATAPEVLGKQAPKSGQLKAGYDADLIGVAGNPLDDLVFLTDPTNVTHVWKGGKSYKSPA